LHSPAIFKKKQGQQLRDGTTAEKLDEIDPAKLVTPGRKTSLRRVGLEAERSRTIGVIVRHKGGVRTLERGVETKVGMPIHY